MRSCINEDTITFNLLTCKFSSLILENPISRNQKYKLEHFIFFYCWIVLIKGLLGYWNIYE